MRGEKLPKRDIRKDPNLRENETEYQVCRFCGTMYEYGDVPCPSCGRKPSDDVWEHWRKAEQK